MGVQVLVQDPDNLDKIRQNEMDICKHRCQKIIEAGANVVLSTTSLSSTSLRPVSLPSAVSRNPI
jgi:T-complex protein 1 subunit alpha